MAVEALAIDIMLPALPNMGDTYSVANPNDRSLVLTLFLVGFGLPQLVFGPASDRFGRRLPILIGLVGYVVGAFGIPAASSFSVILGLRFAQGVSAAAIRVCPQLVGLLDAKLPAYCMVGLPDFFPKVTQRDLMVWWRDKVPEPIREALWAIHPLALSQTRIAGNITLPVGFSIEDNTITAIVSQPTEGEGPVQPPNGPWTVEKVGLPDGAIGLFDPGWDTSQGIHYRSPDLPLQKFLSGYGLGSPFIEDAKICAAFGAYWPGVAPDSTRQYAPDKKIGGVVYPYPTIAPLTDEEIGSAPIENGQFMPWDGVRGPRLSTFQGRPVAAYADIMRVDYIDTLGTMTAALTSRIDTDEYLARILAMEAVYWGLGIHDPDITPWNKVVGQKAAWAVLSFRALKAEDSGLAAAEQTTGVKLAGPRRYFFHVYRWGKATRDPDDMRTVYVDMLEQAFAYVSGNTVLMQRDGGSWTVDQTMPT